MFPQKADMRFKQDRNGRLIIIVTVTYNNGKTQTLEGFGDADLISAIQMAMGKNIEGLHEYSKTEHDVEIATESENLVFGEGRCSLFLPSVSLRQQRFGFGFHYPRFHEAIRH